MLSQFWQQTHHVTPYCITRSTAFCPVFVIQADSYDRNPKAIQVAGATRMTTLDSQTSAPWFMTIPDITLKSTSVAMPGETWRKARSDHLIGFWCRKWSNLSLKWAVHGYKYLKGNIVPTFPTNDSYICFNGSTIFPIWESLGFGFSSPNHPESPRNPESAAWM